MDVKEEQQSVNEEIETEEPEEEEFDIRAHLPAVLEALLLAAEEPVTVRRFMVLTRLADPEAITTTLEELQKQYEERGVQLQAVAGGYQFRTNPAYAPLVQRLVAGRPVRLSRAQTETLAIVAYRQPITRPEIDDIRGVDSGGTLRILLDRNLIRVLGKKEEPGRPLLYGTTKEFLEFFNLSELSELPTLREFSELTEDSAQKIELAGHELPNTEEIARVLEAEQAEAAEAGSGDEDSTEEPSLEGAA
jgi:segregation and condensation protein B